MVNIALAHSTANHLTIHMLSTMHFSLVVGPMAGPIPDTEHVLDMVPCQVEYRFQDTPIPHHLHPFKLVIRGSRGRMALILVILEEFRSHHLTLLMVGLVHLMVQCLWAWELVPHIVLQCPWMSLRLIKGQPWAPQLIIHEVAVPRSHIPSNIKQVNQDINKDTKDTLSQDTLSQLILTGDLPPAWQCLLPPRQP